jgi:hypothetical protein
MAVLAVATTLAGCSSSSEKLRTAAQELRTPGQSMGFVAEVASGEPYGDWQLASNASQQAAQAWAARTTIGDLGNKLRGAAFLSPHGNASWRCEMARNLVSLGAVGEITSFNSDDVGVVTGDAMRLGVKQGEISAMIHDASTVPFRDLAIATAVACGPKV